MQTATDELRKDVQKKTDERNYKRDLHHHELGFVVN